MGGETCALSERAHCEVALDELSRFHWTFLNGDYHPDVIGRFQSEGCWGGNCREPWLSVRP